MQRNPNGIEHKGATPWSLRRGGIKGEGVFFVDATTKDSRPRCLERRSHASHFWL